MYAYDMNIYCGKELEQTEDTGECVATKLCSTINQTPNEVSFNCHTTREVNVLQTNKDGSRETVNCPESIAYYNAHMGGVGLSDQLVELYNMDDRKSLKWRNNVFCRL
nr:unnamed protein product [Callosobruchus analis]